MIEATTHPPLRRAAQEAHIQRSLVAWQMIGAIARLPARLSARLSARLLARLLARNGKRAARQDGPSTNLRCTA